MPDARKIARYNTRFIKKSFGKFCRGGGGFKVAGYTKSARVSGVQSACDQMPDELIRPSQPGLPNAPLGLFSVNKIFNKIFKYIKIINIFKSNFIKIIIIYPEIVRVKSNKCLKHNLPS